MVKSQYYPKKAFLCHGQNCCKHDTYAVNPRLIELLDKLHELVGLNLVLGDVYRCPKYSIKLGKNINSQHTKGNAAIIFVPKELTLQEFVSYCEQLPFDGIGIYEREDQSYVEVDVRNNGIGSNIRWQG